MNDAGVFADVDLRATILDQRTPQSVSPTTTLAQLIPETEFEYSQLIFTSVEQITGPSCYSGAHVLNQPFSKGYRVHGTVRSQQKIEQIRRKDPTARDNLKLLFVEGTQCRRRL